MYDGVPSTYVNTFKNWIEFENKDRPHLFASEVYLLPISPCAGRTVASYALAQVVHSIGNSLPFPSSSLRFQLFTQEDFHVSAFDILVQVPLCNSSLVLPFAMTARVN